MLRVTQRPWKSFSTEDLFTLLTAAKRRSWELGVPASGQLPSPDQRATQEEIEGIERELLMRDEI